MVTSSCCASHRSASTSTSTSATLWVVPITRPPRRSRRHAAPRRTTRRASRSPTRRPPSSSTPAGTGSSGSPTTTSCAPGSTGDALRSLDTLERYNLVDDAWNAVIAGRLAATDLLTFLEGFADEREYAVWQAIVISLRGLGRLLDDEAFARFQQRVAAPRRAGARRPRRSGRHRDRSASASSVGCSPARSPCSATTPRRRPGAASCTTGRSREPGSVDPELVAAATSRRRRDRRRGRVRADARPASARRPPRRTSSATSTRWPSSTSAELIDRTCEFALSGEVKTQNAPFLLRTCIANRRHGARAWTFVRKNWAEVNERVPVEHDHPHGRHGEDAQPTDRCRRHPGVLLRAPDRAGRQDPRTGPRAPARQRRHARARTRRARRTPCGDGGESRPITRRAGQTLRRPAVSAASAPAGFVARTSSSRCSNATSRVRARRSARSSTAACRSRTCRAWIVDDGDRRPAAAVVLVRPTFDRWYATVLLLDERAAADVAAIVDRSPAWSVNGAATDIAPLLPFLRRKQSVDVRPWVVTAICPVELTDVPDDTTRLREPGRPRRARRAVLDVRVRRRSDGVAVAVDAAPRARPALHHRRRAGRATRPGSPVHWRRPTRTRRYGVLDLLTVVPDHRGAGWSWALVARAQTIGNALGLAEAWRPWSGSNPMNFDVHMGDDTYIAVRPGAAPDDSAGRVACASSTVGGSRCSPGSADLVPRNLASCRSAIWIEARARQERRPFGHRPRHRVRPEGIQLIEPWPRPRPYLRHCRSSASTLTRDSTAGRSYCISVSFRRGGHLPRLAAGVTVAVDEARIPAFIATKRCRFVQTP